MAARYLSLNRLGTRQAGVGAPHYRIVAYLLPREEPGPIGETKWKARCTVSRPGRGGQEETISVLRLGGVRRYLPNSRVPAHGTLRVAISRRISSTAAMRSPTERVTGPAIELPRAL